jgi:hypothetical protein
METLKWQESWGAIEQRELQSKSQSFANLKLTNLGMASNHFPASWFCKLENQVEPDHYKERFIILQIRII